MVLLFLHSNDGTQNNSDETDITWDVSSQNVLSHNRKFTIALRQLEFPMSFYNVRSTNNTVNLAEGGNAAVSYTIPVKNYTADELRDALTALLPNITCTYDLQTNKFTFTHASSTDFTLSGNSYKLLGLTAASGQNSSNSSTITADNMVNLVGPTYLTVRLVETNHTTYPFRLGKVQLSAEQLAFVHYDETNPAVFEIDGYPTITSLRLRLEDANNNSFELNNIPWSATLDIQDIDGY